MGVPQTSPLAIGSLVCGILAILSGCCCGIIGLALGVAALVMGIMALRQTKAEPHAFSGGGLAIGGIVTGAIALLFATVMLIIGAGSALVDQFNH
jgi:hypothetical protein